MFLNVPWPKKKVKMFFFIIYNILIIEDYNKNGDIRPYP
jgi:hypothetical protein